MRLLSYLVLLTGFLIASSVGYLVLQRINGQNETIIALQNRIGKNIELKKIAVAARDLKYGTTLTKKDIKGINWPVETIPEFAFTSSKDLFGDENAENPPRRIVLRAIDKGEIISRRKITEFGQDIGIAARLAAGVRAFTLKVDVSSGVSGFLRPGDHVDIYWTGQRNGTTITQLILDGVELIAIDQLSDTQINRPNVARTVTVAVTPEIVATLAQAQATGTLQLSLRGIEDTTKSGDITVDQKTLFGIEENKKCYITTRKDGQRQQVEIPCRN